jgi:UDP-N-acetylmuramoylalanine--D-glutamate ligase
MTQARQSSTGGRVLVYGLGRSGIAIAHFLTSTGVAFDVYDDKPNAAYRTLSNTVDWDRVSVHFEKLPSDAATRYQRAIVSPGVPPTAKALVAIKAAGIPVIGEIELAYELLKPGARGAPEIVAVTGTNGKTTTVTMTELLIQKAGLTSQATGNIGYPFTQAVLDKNPDFFVLEVSSFQLYHVDQFRPKIAIVTSFAPNHLDWHPDEADYLAAKLNIVRRMDSTGTVIYPASSEILAKALAKCPARKITFGEGGDVSLDRQQMAIVKQAETLIPLSGLVPTLSYDYRIVSEAMQAAAAVSVALNLPSAAFPAMLKEFAPLKHRIEFICRKGGITYINDSKSTSVDATVFALDKQSEPVVLMLGGHDKGLSYRAIAAAGKGRVKAVVAFGEAREKIAREIAHDLPTHQATNLTEAVDQARHLAQPGDIVLFSPACSSYDQFKNYEERGEAFRKIVTSI